MKPRGVAVMLEAEHMCMSLRGVEKPGSSTITTQFTGSFRDNPDDQVRFITMVREGAERLLSASVRTAPRWPRLRLLRAPIAPRGADRRS